MMIWRVRETRTAVSARKIVIPPLGMATGLGMFAVPMFRVPWTWALAAFLAGAMLLAIPVIRTSRLVREGDAVMMKRSNAFFAVLVALALVRVGARGYLDTVMTVQHTAALFFLLAFGMIVRWRTQMYLEFRSLVRQ